ncbi:MAG: hypothetical protein ABUL60_24205 [Myxococcales bacterium]
MRLLLVPLLLFVAGSAKVCDSADKAKADASGSVAAQGSASADAKVALAAPRIGGTVANAGDFSVELAVHRSGLVEALVSDASGKLVSDGVKLSATVQTKAGAAEKLELGFVPARARFEGHAKAGVELSAGPVAASLEAAGKKLDRQLNVAATLPEPRIGGHVLAAGAFSAEVLASPSGEVRALVSDSAGAEVTGALDAKLSATVSTTAGARETIALAFDAGRACFAGKAKAGVELAPGPLEFSVDAKVGGGIGRLEGIGLSVAASHGGQVIAVGDFSVELVAKGQAISAFVLDASGKAHVGGDLDLKLLVGAGAGSELGLKWDAPSASYTGKIAANVDLGLEPLRVALVAGGKAFVGGVASLNAAAKANAKLDGKLAVDAKLDAKAKLAADAKAKVAADAQAKLDQAAKAAASIKVTAPKVDLSAKKSASASAKAGGGKADAKASAGFSFGTH